MLSGRQWIREKNGLEVYMAHTDVVFPDEEELPLKEEGDRIFPCFFRWLRPLAWIRFSSA